MQPGECVRDPGRVVMGDYINDNAPFGPVASEEITDRQLWEELFDRENQVYTDLKSKDPALVIGRRGAGKTAFLFALTTDTPTINVKVNTSTAVAEVADVRRELSGLGVTLFTAHVADIWDAVLWHSCLSQIVLQPNGAIDVHDHRFQEIRSYLEDLGGAGYVPDEGEVLAAFCHEFVDQVKSRPIIARNPSMFTVHDTRLAQIVADARGLCAAAKVAPVLLMDSMEDFRDVLDRHTKTFEGLFMHIGRSAQPAAPYRIRFSFPAELINVLGAMAANPLKDFGKRILLQWSAGEIAQIAAYRFSLYLRMYHADFLESKPALARPGTYDRGDAFELLKFVLPDSVSGELGVREDTIGYVLRHTQLLPRHLLRMLNAVWSKNAANGNPPTEVDEAAVVEGIRIIETDIVNEIFKAYELVHPLAYEVCRAIVKHLPRRFGNSLLQKTYNRHGKAALRRAYKKRLAQDESAALSIDQDLPLMDYFDFRSMLGEIGCIGRVIPDKETDRYCVAYFEYAMPGRLGLGDEDEFCLHPLFSGVFQAKDTSGEDPKAVYPYGSDHSQDHRLASPRMM